MNRSVRWPALLRPMLAVPGDLPTDGGWAYEFKWDGVRTIAYVTSGGATRLLSRNDKDVTASYPELAVLPTLLGRHTAVLDGEIVTLDARGAPSFSALQRRMHVASPSAALVAAAPARYVVFDLLHLDRPLIAQPWQRRRAALEQLALQHSAVAVPPAYHRDPRAMMAAAREQGLEGVVSKQVASTYQPGRRSPAWRKTPLINTTEVIIGGYKPGAGRRAGLIGSLILGMYDPDGRLAYVGGVGTGFTTAMLTDLGRRLRPLHRPTPPFATPLPAADARNAQWVEPELVGDVVYRNWTPDGRLRHPSWRGLRSDRTAAEIRLPR
jgi:bifunctional non-homologous end joining protein LigD